MNPYWKWFTNVSTNYKPLVEHPAGDHVIITYAKSYSLGELGPLVRSIKHSSCDPFILISDLPDADGRTLKALGGQVVTPHAGSGWSPLPMFERVVEVLCILRALPPEIDKVVWCDSRDVIFQRDPFEDAFEAEIVLYSQADSPALSRTATGRWLARALGEDILQPIGHLPMANCGVILAQRNALERFLHIAALIGGVAKYRLSRLPGFGLEQALFNYIAHYQLAGPTIVARNLGRVANLYGVDPQYVTISDGLLCSAETEQPFEIVHQFDRHPRFIDWAVSQFGWENVEHSGGPFGAAWIKKSLRSLAKRLPEIR